MQLIADDDENDVSKKDFKRKPIHIYINSYGGCCADGLALIDIIENSNTPIYTYAIGKCMSMGLHIFMVGHKRFTAKRTEFMLQRIGSCVGGKLENMRNNMKSCEYTQKVMNELTHQYTKLTQADIDSVIEMQKDWFFYADEAIKFGFADEIMKKEVV